MALMVLSAEKRALMAQKMFLLTVKKSFTDVGDI